MKTFKRWKIIEVGGEQRVQGKIYNHPGFPDGTRITTSAVKKIEKDKSGEMLITINGSIYKLVDRLPVDDAKLVNAADLDDLEKFLESNIDDTH